MIITSISLAFSIPVLLSSYDTVILFVSSLRYPRILGSLDPPRENLPLVSVLIASYNEKFVIGRTLDAIKDLEYPAGKLQVIVADDSTDDTRSVIDEKVEELNSSGIVTLISRRNTREGFKSGALNHAAPLLRREYVPLLDADSRVTPGSLPKGLAAFRSVPRLAFVSFRVGHYNREQNLITRLFTLISRSGGHDNEDGVLRS
jgi:cellulose synthase/poly-beta-1,6-N-acetylglucosamine synthase-like glycosyltransferase